LANLKELKEVTFQIFKESNYTIMTLLDSVRDEKVFEVYAQEKVTTELVVSCLKLHSDN